MHSHVYMKRVHGVQAGATQIQIDLSGELNVYLVQVKVINVDCCNFKRLTSALKLEIKLFKYHLSEMCTGSYTEENRTLAAKGTKCEGPCIHKGGRWGASYCNTNLTDKENGWGAECVLCSGNIRLISKRFIAIDQTNSIHQNNTTNQYH